MTNQAAGVEARSQPRRIGLVVPSSNTTIETELPDLLRRYEERSHERFTFHSSRATLHTVDPVSLHDMVDQGERCIGELADARVDVVGYACLVALMAEGPRAHEQIEPALAEIAAGRGVQINVVSSAGALVRTLTELRLRRVAVVAPYVPDLTKLVVGYIEEYGVEVVDSISLGVADNVAVGRLDPGRLPDRVRSLNIRRADGIVLSACVQMPSLSAVPLVEEQTGLPVVTAATATTREILVALGLRAVVSGGGAALI